MNGEKERKAPETEIRGRDVIRIASLAFTRRGRDLAARTEAACRKVPGRELIWENVKTIDEKTFRTADALFFFCASGIAVRKIAPLLKSKTSDPAVLVTGEDGKYVISLLSGHLGKANAWAEEVAEALGAQPVITTASDVRKMPALDVWASECGLAIDDMKLAGRIAAYLLSLENEDMTGKEQRSDGPEIRREKTGDGSGGKTEYRICITEEADFPPDGNTLILRPRRYVLGVGCRRDTDPDKMEEFLLKFLRDNGIDRRLVRRICSVDRKKDEDAVKAAARMLGVPFTVFSADELAAVPGCFRSSDFVRETVGVGNVCERAAVLGAGPGSRLTAGKTAAGGMTAAAACMPFAAGEKRILKPEEWLALASGGTFPDKV